MYVLSSVIVAKNELVSHITDIEMLTIINKNNKQHVRLQCPENLFFETMYVSKFFMNMY